MRFKLKSLFILTAIIAMLAAGWRMHTIPFLPTILHWPFDAIRGHVMRVTTRINQYDVTLVQVPGSDLYETYFVISDRNTGHFSKVMIAPDDIKWRSPRLITKNDIIYFTDGGHIDRATPHINTATLILNYEIVTGRRSTVALPELKLNGGWGR
jgi:hypothetical protein